MVSEIRTERTNFASQLQHLDAALTVLGNLDGGHSYTEPRHTLSASVRRKMSLAQKARWARRAEKTVSAPVEHTMSVSARSKIAADQRARWATLRAGQKNPA